MPKPVLQALVLADHVYQDKSTGKMIISGTFNRLQVFKSPPRGDQALAPGQPPPEGLRKLGPNEICRAGSPWAYISVTEVHGNVPLQLRYLDLRDNVVLLGADLSVAAQSPLETVEVAVPLPVLPLPHPGSYVLELLANGEPLGSHRVTVVEMPPASPATPEAGT